MKDPIKCKDCKYWWKENETCIHEKNCQGYVCVIEAPADHYCGYAEKKEERKE